MNENWFKDPNHVVYMSVDEFVSDFEKELQIENLKFAIQEFRQNWKAEGKTISGVNQASIKLFIPKLTFSDRMEKDENVWVFLGENHPCICLNHTEPWRDKAYSFFSHKECEFFPCHETKDPDEFNCLFCFCPLYALGKHCGGNFRYKGELKDCSECMLPHSPDRYGYITGKFHEIAEIASKNK